MAHGLRNWAFAPLVWGVAVSLAVTFGDSRALAADVTFDPSLSLTEEYSDNVDLEPSDLAQDAFITRLTPGGALRWLGPRMELNLNAFLSLRHQTAGEDEGFNLDPNILGFGTLEMVPEYLFLDASTSISRQRLDSELADTEANRAIVQEFRVSPYLRNKYGRFAVSELRYVFDSFVVHDKGVIGGEDVSDAMQHAGIVTISSGTDFQNLAWSLNGRISELQRRDSTDVSRRDADLGFEYPVIDSFTAIVGGGYQHFDDGIPENEFDSPTWRVGFRYNPHPDLLFEFTYGQHDDELSPTFFLRYGFGPGTTLTAGYAETLGVSQGRLERTLSYIALDPETGEFIDERTGGAFNPNPSPFSIDNDTTRVDEFLINIFSARGRNAWSLDGRYATETIEPTGEEEDDITVSGAYSRRLNRRTTWNVVGGYERTKFADGVKDDEYTASTSLVHALRPDLRVEGGYSYRHQNSNDPGNEFRENRFLIGVTKDF